MTNTLELINLSKTYDTKEAVKNISFKLAKNEIVGILGPNGCGKTTTIGMILGLLKPSAGKILINGENAYVVIDRVNVEINSSANSDTVKTWYPFNLVKGEMSFVDTEFLTTSQIPPLSWISY